jgi:chromosome segregation ATPase
MVDYMEKSKQDRGIFERISLYIPGYSGYRQRNMRRDIDRLVRSHVALSIKEVKTVMADLKRQVMDNGDLQSVKAMERITVKIDTYMKTIESAESGYSGMWETIKTNESDLDSIVEWDEKLVVGSEELKAALKELRDRVDEGSADVKKELREIERYVDDLKDGLNERKLVIKGLADRAEQENRESPAPAEEAEEPEAEEPKKRGLFRRK